MCYIVHGTEVNVDSLSQEAVDSLVLSEVCVIDSKLDLTPPKLERVTDFDAWNKKFERHLMGVRNDEGIPLFYVIRDDDQRPAAFRDLTEEIMWKIPHLNNLATFRRDNNEVFRLVLDLMSSNKTLLSFAKADGAEQPQDGRKAYLNVRRCCIGIDAKEDKRALFDTKLRAAVWTGFGQGQAGTQLVANLFDCYAQLELLGETFTDLQKIRLFKQNCRAAPELVGTTCFKAVTDKAKEYIRAIQRGQTEDREGCELTFAAFTQFVIDEERQWIKDLKAKRSISQVSSSDSFSHADSIYTIDEAEDDDLSSCPEAVTDTEDDTDTVSCKDEDSSVG